MRFSRTLPIGAHFQSGQGTHFRVWAPRRRQVTVVLESEESRSQGTAQLERDENGYWSGAVPAAGSGTLYRFRLDGEEKLFPDPASRFQPQGVHGPSQVVD